MLNSRKILLWLSSKKTTSLLFNLWACVCLLAGIFVVMVHQDYRTSLLFVLFSVAFLIISLIIKESYKPCRPPEGNS